MAACFNLFFINLKKFLFEPMTPDLISIIENEIFGSFEFWLPFVNIIELNINLELVFNSSIVLLSFPLNGFISVILL